MFKKFLILLCFIFLFANNAHAFTPTTFVTLVNPVRGREGWQGGAQDPLDLPRFQYQESTHSAFPTTWALRYDAITDASISAYFKDLTEKDKNQSLSAFLEITPQLANISHLQYPDGTSFFNANRIFLSGYAPTERQILIDRYMDSFFQVFGFYPKSVVAWHLDSYSLQYLQTKYSILAAMNCDDQYSTDHYRLWGGYLGSAYFPDKNNSLIPASSAQNRVNLAMVRWAQRDLYNFYGFRSESSYSVQVNDYLSQGLDTQYFTKLLALYEQKNFNEFTYLNVGLENDYSLNAYQKEIKSVYQSLALNRDKYSLRFVSLADFGDWFKARYPESSPAYFYQTSDPTSASTGHIYWYQTPYYRIGLKSENNHTKIIDLRVYNRNIYEEYFSVANIDLDLYQEIPAIIDSVKYPGTAVEIGIDLSQATYARSKQWDGWSLSYNLNQSHLILEPDRIVFIGQSVPQINSSDILVTKQNNTVTWKMSPQSLYKSTHLTSLTWLILIVLLITIIKKIRNAKPSIFFGLASVLLIGLTVFRNGQNYPFGLGFWGPNGHDAIFHLSVIEKFVADPFNLSHPQFSGLKITNYHFLFDYLSSIIIKITGISSLDWYFRVFPLLAGIAIVLLLYRLLTNWGLTEKQKSIVFILTFLSGSLGYLPRLISGQDIFSGESAFWSSQSASLFLNPPYVLSLVFLLAILVGLDKTKPTFWELIGLFFVGGLLAQTKIYAYILLCISLLLAKKYRLFIGVSVFGLLVSIPFLTPNGQAPFLFSPLWFPRSLFASFDRFYWPQLVSAWQVYEASGNLIKLLGVNAFALIVFLVGNIGLRLLGFIDIFKTKNAPISEKIVHHIIYLGIIIPLIFIQNVNPWNTIQFLYYSLFFLAIPTGRYLAKIKYLYLPLMILAIATSVGTLKDYIGPLSAARVSYTEQLALTHLSKQPKGVVLAPVFDQIKSRLVPTPKPLYAYISTAYISALSGQPEFLSDTINLDITGFTYKDRIRDIQRFYKTEDKNWAIKFLIDNQIKYIIETPLQKITLAPSDLKLVRTFDSGEINIYKFNGHGKD